MTQLVTALFEDRASAERARDRLVAAGIAAGRISIEEPDAGAGESGSVAGPLDSGLIQAVRDHALPDRETRSHEASPRGGAAFLSAHLDGRDPAEAVRILEEHGAREVDAGGGAISGGG